MNQLTIHQEKVLTQIATGKIKFYATQMSIEADGVHATEVDAWFAEDMQLVEQGLLYNVTSKPQFKEYADKVLETDGRTIFVLTATPAVAMMFGRPTGVPN